MITSLQTDRVKCGQRRSGFKGAVRFLDFGKPIAKVTRKQKGPTWLRPKLTSKRHNNLE